MTTWDTKREKKGVRKSTILENRKQLLSLRSGGGSDDLFSCADFWLHARFGCCLRSYISSIKIVRHHTHDLIEMTAQLDHVCPAQVQIMDVRYFIDTPSIDTFVTIYRVFGIDTSSKNIIGYRYFSFDTNNIIRTSIIAHFDVDFLVTGRESYVLTFVITQNLTVLCGFACSLNSRFDNILIRISIFWLWYNKYMVLISIPTSDSHP